MPKETLLNFLKLNAFFLKVRDIYVPYADTKAVCIIPTVMESEIGVRAQMDELTINRGITRNGQVYYTTPHGLILLIDFEFTAEMVFNIRDYWLVYPEDIVTLIQKSSLPLKESVYSRKSLLLTKAQINEALSRIKENVEKIEIAKLEHEAKQINFFKFIRENGGTDLLAERLWGFDVFYGYSDDIKVFHVGADKEKQLLSELAKFNICGKTTMDMLYKAKSL